MVTSLRTRKTYKRYKKFIADGNLKNGCNLCKKSKDQLVKKFKYWKIVKNRFPWDFISKTNHLIIPKRHIVYEKLNNTEKREFDSIKLDYIGKKYDIIVEALEKSIPEHFHVHLIILKDKI